MIVAALQMQPAGTVAANLAAIETAAKAAASLGAFILVTPEMGVTGYAIWEDIPRLAEPRDGSIVRALQAIARDHHIAIVAGFPERDGETIYNSAALIQPNGARSFYRKCHLFGPLEKAAFTAAANHSGLVTIQNFTIGMVICYDVEFPEMVRNLALAGANLIIVPTALPRGPSAVKVSDVTIPARAFENHVFVIYADLCGEENNTPYQGHSVIAAPDGEILARAGATPSLLVTTLNPKAYKNLDPYLEDRRPELYQKLSK